MLARILPKPQPTILDVLLDDAFLPAAGDIAEVRVEQVVGGHRREARIDDAGFALLHLVDRRLHVVVDAAPGNAAQGGKRAGVRIEQHFVALRWVGLNHESPTGAELQMRGKDLAPDAANDQVFFAPVKLEGFAQLEVERDIGFADCGTTISPPASDELGDPAVGAGETGRLQLTKEFQRGAPIPLWPTGIRFQCLDETRCIRRNLDVWVLPFVLRFRPFRCPQPALDGVPAISCLPRNLRQRHAVPVKQPTNPSQILHGDHLQNPAQKMSRRVNHPGQFSARTTSLFWSVFNERQQSRPSLMACSRLSPATPVQAGTC